MKKNNVKKMLCGAIAAFAAATALLCANGTVPRVKADADEAVKYAVSAGDYALKTDDAVCIDLNYEHGAYLYNKRATEGNITLRFKTVSFSTTLASSHFNGLTRGDFTNIAYAYAPFNSNYWYVFGSGVQGDGTQSLHSVGEYTNVLYDVTSHSFSVSVGGTTPTMAKMFSSADGATVDALGVTHIAWDSNNAEAIFSASLTDFAISDEDGFYLGVAAGRMSDARINYTLEEDFYAYAGKTVTVKYFGDDTASKLSVFGDDGKKADVDITDHGNGIYSFVMPAQSVRLEECSPVSADKVYGTYLNAESGNTFVLGESSYKTINGVKTDVSYTAYSDGTIKITENGSTTEATVTIANLKINGVTYKRLLKYSVNFVANGETVKSEILSSGDYKVTAPAAPVKEGYVFDGWKNGKGEAFDETKMITASVTYYASFKEAGGHIDPEPEEEITGGCNSSVNYSIFTLIPCAALACVYATVLLVKTKREGGN